MRDSDRKTIPYLPIETMFNRVFDVVHELIVEKHQYTWRTPRHLQPDRAGVSFRSTLESRRADARYAVMPQEQFAAVAPRFGLAPNDWCRPITVYGEDWIVVGFSPKNQKTPVVLRNAQDQWAGYPAKTAAYLLRRSTTPAVPAPPSQSVGSAALTATSVKSLIAEIREAVKPLIEDSHYMLNLHTGHVERNRIALHMRLALPSEGDVETMDRRFDRKAEATPDSIPNTTPAAFSTAADQIGIDAGYHGLEFTVHGYSYTVAGIDPDRKKTPAICRRSDGKLYYLDADTVTGIAESEHPYECLPPEEWPIAPGYEHEYFDTSEDDDLDPAEIHEDESYY